MPHHEERTATGTITHVFGHRFVLKTKRGYLLADLTPHGEDKIRLRIDDEVTVEGEMKPTELKVFKFTRDGKSVRIEHGPKHGPKHHHHDHHHPDADPQVAIEAAKKAGYKMLGEPRRKPKHFEILGRKKDDKKSKLTELHIELDGNIRKMKPVDADDDKWAEAIEAYA